MLKDLNVIFFYIYNEYLMAVNSDLSIFLVSKSSLLAIDKRVYAIVYLHCPCNKNGFIGCYQHKTILGYPN